MKVNRRRFLQTTAATAAAGMLGSTAWADDPISVASIHDLSGGLDIYGKPMVDALTLAVEEANAAGGLLGRQIELINYDPQSNMQLYTQFAQQAALKDKVAVVHGGITSASREAIRPVLDRFKTLYFYNTQYEGGVCDRDQFGTGVDPGADGGKARALRDEEMGQESLCRRRRLQLRPDHLAVGEEIRQRERRRGPRRSISSRSTSPISARPSPRSRRRSPISCGRRWSAARISPSIASGRRPACTRDPDGVDHLRGGQRAHRAVARGMQRHAGLLQLFRGPEEPGQRGFRRPLPQALRRRLSQHHRTRHGDLSGLPALGRRGQEGRQRRPPEGHRGARNRHQHRRALAARSRSTRRRITASSTFISPKSRTRSSRCWRTSPSRSPPTPPPSAT